MVFHFQDVAWCNLACSLSWHMYPYIPMFIYAFLKIVMLWLQERPSTKVHAAPGGGSSLDYLFGGGSKWFIAGKSKFLVMQLRCNLFETISISRFGCSYWHSNVFDLIKQANKPVPKKFVFRYYWFFSVDDQVQNLLDCVISYLLWVQNKIC